MPTALDSPRATDPTRSCDLTDRTDPTDLDIAAASPWRGARVVVTGGSSGIGRAVSRQLIRAGAKVVVGSRRTVCEPVEYRALDLACLRSVRDFADELARDGNAIDMLLLNAGVHVPWKRVTTTDGEELHWQVNYLANVLLARTLVDAVRRSRLRRIVYVASEAHRMARLPGVGPLRFWHRYARSKEAAVTFFLRLRQLHPDLDIRVVSPGYVDTGIHLEKSPALARLERAWSRPRTAAEAARELLGVALADSVAFEDDCGYWDRGRRRAPAPRCLDDARADRLWRSATERLAGSLPDVRPPERVVNYAGNFRALHAAIERPGSVAEVAHTVRSAAGAGRPVRAVGRRHSYNDSFYSPGCMISLERLDRVLAFDAAVGTVTCEGGIPIGALCRHLDERGYRLRYSGNFGDQTLAGALATGTHGYGRDGGVMCELVRAMTVVLADGSVERVVDEARLRALRLGLGTLGVVVDVTMAVEPIAACLYEVACMPRDDFQDRLAGLARRNEYLRFVPHPFDRRSMVYVTLNRIEGDGPLDDARYIGDARAGAARMLVPPLRIPAVRALLGRALRVSQHTLALRVPLSGTLFIRSGLVDRHARLARAGQLALDRPDWLNMELALPHSRYSDFSALFEHECPPSSALSRRRPYYTCRVVGAADNVLLAPNYGRDVVFVDVHADPSDPRSLPFLRSLEAVATATMDARPHWGKISFLEDPCIRSLYPAENIEAFVAMKRKLDPGGVFSNDFTRRVLGV